MRTNAILLAAILLPAVAFAHCPVSYVLTGPGGIAWQINLGGVTSDGVLPGGTTSRLGPMTSWDTRREGQTIGVMTAGHVFTDGTHYAVCPPLKLNVSGPPQCSEDGEPGAVGHPLCILYFTVVQTSPGAFSCSSTCLPGPMPVQQNYTPPATTPATITALSPGSVKAGSPAVALSVNGTRFGGTSFVQWNGTPVATAYVSSTTILALVPAAMLAAPGTAGVTVATPGSVSASASFTTTP